MPWDLLGGIVLLAVINRFLFISGLGGEYAIGSFLLLPGGMVMAVAFVFLWMMITGFIHLTAGFCKAEGSVIGLFMLFGFSLLPSVFLMPLDMFFKSGIIHGNALEWVMFMLINLWVLSLAVIAVRINYECSIEKAILIMVLPLVLLFIAVTGIIFLTVSSIIMVI